jgi:hypothetical protein
MMLRVERCAHWWERRSKGRRYVNARGQCKRTTAHPSRYCKEHRYGYRWSAEQEAALPTVPVLAQRTA